MEKTLLFFRHYLADHLLLKQSVVLWSYHASTTQTLLATHPRA